MLHTTTYVMLVITIAKCQQAKILPLCTCCSICLEMSWITVLYKNTGCRLVIYVSIIYLLDRFEIHSALELSRMIVFARKQCILCSASRHKSYLTLPYVTLLRDLFCHETFANSFIMLPPRNLASSWGCLLAIKQIYSYCNAMNAKTTDS